MIAKWGWVLGWARLCMLDRATVVRAYFNSLILSHSQVTENVSEMRNNSTLKKHNSTSMISLSWKIQKQFRKNVTLVNCFTLEMLWKIQSVAAIGRTDGFHVRVFYRVSEKLFFLSKCQDVEIAGSHSWNTLVIDWFILKNTINPIHLGWVPK